MPPVYLPDHQNLPPRNTKDNTINEYSRSLISLRTSNQLRILNGRLKGDEQGEHTFYGANGSSLVDFVLASEQLYLKSPTVISSMKINKNALSFSDHCSVHVSLDVTKRHKENQNSNILTEERPPRYIWCDRMGPVYAEQFNSEQNERIIKSLSSVAINSNVDVDQTINKISHLLTSSARGILRLKTFKKKAHRRKFKTQWYNRSCSDIKSRLNNTIRLLKAHPNDPFLRGRICRLRKLYKREIRNSKRKHKASVLHELNHAMNTNKSKFWQLIKSTRALTNRTETLPEAAELRTHFKELHEDKNIESDIDDILMQEQSQIDINSTRDLNKDIDSNEIINALKLLKRKKSPGRDGILAEMIHSTSDKLINVYKNLFNQIFQSGYFPDSWKESFILPLFKSGDKLISSNYRGISLTSILGKLFCLILNERLTAFLDKNNIIHESQGGFQKNRQTIDHLFCLKTLISKYTKKNGKLFTCFIDLKKAFDTVWHPGLLLKLKQLSINGPFYEIIQNLYINNKAHLIYNNHLTEPISPSIGVRQGCIISPNLFNIYMNDFAKTLTCQFTDPVFLADKSLNCLMFADDITLFSQNKEGLQKCLEKTFLYCNHWKLKINYEKSKCIIFSKKSINDQQSFSINNNAIDTVKTYKYLGFIFHSSCKQSFGIKQLCTKAEKAWSVTQRFMRQSSTSYVAVHRTMYNTMIKPIILYASAVWGDSIMHTENNPIEAVQRDIMCKMLCVRRNSSKVTVRAELGIVPLLIDLKIIMIKFLLRMINSGQNSLLYKAFSEQVLENSPMSWLGKVQHHLSEIGISLKLLISKETNTKYNQLKLINSIKKQLINRYKLNFEQSNLNSTTIGQSNQLKFYKTIKNKFEFENYLLLPNKKTRIAITQIRISAHRLGVQTGRYFNIPYDERFCPHCDNDNIDDEMHLLFICNHNSDLRLAFFEHLKKLYSNFSSMSISDKLQLLFSQPSIDINKLLGTFVYESLQKRYNT